jgi:hypothetical protein
MRRDEILRGLECCCGDYRVHCEACTYRPYTDCVRLRERDVLSLAHELTFENEKLKAELANRPPKLIITRRNTRRK